MYAAAIDATGEFPHDIRELFAAHDILALPFEERYGGTGTGTLMTVVAIEEIAKALATTTKELTLPIKKLLSDKRISSRGTRRATKYFPR